MNTFKKHKIEYLKCDENSSKIQEFWLKFNLEVEKDKSLTLDYKFELHKSFVGSVAGDWAGIMISIVLALPSCTLASAQLWKMYIEHIIFCKNNGLHQRVISIDTLQEICGYELIKNEIYEFDLVESKTLVAFHNQDEFDYLYNEAKQKVMKFVFSSEKGLHEFVIDCDGEIRNYKFTENKITSRK